MGKYRLKYASVGGSITGKAPGDAVTVTGDEEKQLLELGLIEPEEDYQERQRARAEAEAEAEESTAEADDETPALRQEIEQLTQQLAQVKAEYSHFQAAANQAGAEGTNERVRLEGELKAAQDRVAQLESQQGATEAEITVNWASLSSVVAPERMAALVTEEEDRMLEPFKGKSGWYSFGEGEDLVKVQGREAAVEELARRVGQSAEAVQQESNPDS